MNEQEDQAERIAPHKPTKPIIKFTARYIYGNLYLKQACDRSSILLQLLGRHLKVFELHLVAKLGFDVLVVGDRREFKAEVARIKNEEEKRVQEWERIKNTTKKTEPNRE